MDELRQRTAGRQPEVIVTAANVAFFITRTMLALGQFNYSRKGILGLGHRRLFHISISLAPCSSRLGTKSSKSVALPAPYPLQSVITAGAALLTLNRSLIKLWKVSFPTRSAFEPAPSLILPNS